MVDEGDIGSEAHYDHDVCLRLSELMRKIEQSARQVRIENANRHHTAINRPLYEAFGPISEHIGFEDYAELRDNFVRLCERAKRDINSIEMKGASTRQRWYEAIETASHVFDASNFALACSEVFSKHFSNLVFERLEAASERLQALGVVETPMVRLEESLQAARDVMNAFEKKGTIPPSIGRVLKHYLQQIEEAYRRYDDFGEEAFWATYKELFATFLQVHNIIIPESVNEADKAEVANAVRTMGDKMKYGLVALSCAADVSTIASLATIFLNAP